MSPPDPFRTYRNPTSQKFGFVAAVVFALLAVTAGDPGDALVFVFGVALAAWSAWWVRLVVARDGVTVWNFRRHHLPWRDIQRVELEDGVWWAWGGPVLRFSLRSRRPLRVWAVAVTRAGGENYVRRTLVEVRQAQGTAGHGRGGAAV